MLRTTTLLWILLLTALPPAWVSAQQLNPFGVRDSAGSRPPARAGADSAARRPVPDAGAVPAGLEGVDSAAYQLLPSSRLQVKTGKAGLFGFAGHSHLIQARGFSGRIVYYPKVPAESRLEITVSTDSLEVLTPPDTAEIRKVTASMRDEVLHVDRYPEIHLVSRQVTRTAEGFHLVGALTMAGQTREVPVDVVVQFGPDSLRARANFSVKQTDFGIKPYSGGPAGTVKVADKVTFDIDAVAARVAGHAATGR